MSVIDVNLKTWFFIAMRTSTNLYELDLFYVRKIYVNIYVDVPLSKSVRIAIEIASLRTK